MRNIQLSETEGSGNSEMGEMLVRMIYLAINWMIVLVMTGGGIVFLVEAFRKDLFKTFSEAETFGSIGTLCVMIGMLFLLNIVFA